MRNQYAIIVVMCVSWGIKMKITVKIKGMSCEHCKMHVEQALSGLSGVKSAEVSLFWNKATIEADKDISDALLRDTIEDIGYEVVAVKR